ncbi:MAG: sodium/solute symporter [Myxococcota bacterium]
MPDLQVTAWDVGILIGYVVLTRVGFGWYFARKTRGQGAESYFLGAHRMRWPIIGLSFYVANMSGGSFVGLPGAAYHTGISVYNYEWMPAVLLILFAFFFLPLFLRGRVYTAPQFLELRFGRGTRLAFSAMLLLTSMLVDAPASLYAGAMVLKTLLPEVPVWLTITIAALAAGVYIAYGGLGAVVANDALQATLILSGGTIIAVLAWQAVPSWEAVVDAAPPEALHLIQPATDEVMPWPGLSGVFIVGMYFWCTNQFIIQRALGARSLDDGRWGALLAGLLKLPNLFILVLPGLFALVLYPDLDNPDMVFPVLAFDLLPVGLRGFMLAVLAAAMLSSLEAILHSASTLFTMDFVHPARPDIDSRTLARWGRVASLVFMGIAVVWTPQIARFPTLWQYLQSILSYLTPPVVAVFLLGLFWPRANAAGALFGIAVGVPLGAVGWVLTELLGWFSVPYLYAAGVMFVAAVALVAMVSLATKPPPAEQARRFGWRLDDYLEDALTLRGIPWYQDYRWQSAGLAVITLCVVVWWW